jgi:chromate transporter
VIAAGCCLTTIWPEAEVAVLFKGASILGVLYTARGFAAAARRFRCAGAQVGIGTAKAPTLSALSHLLVFFLKTYSLTFGSGLVIVPSSSKTSCSRPDG